ncbi:MAG: hypothetical protein LBL32_02625 [Holosporales bacterium]|jgi:hypothetical protein|nr:hypothetical protein [Holosporales bacterium]
MLDILNEVLRQKRNTMNWIHRLLSTLSVVAVFSCHTVPSTGPSQISPNYEDMNKDVTLSVTDLKNMILLITNLARATLAADINWPLWKLINAILAQAKAAGLVYLINPDNSGSIVSKNYLLTLFDKGTIAVGEWINSGVSQAELDAFAKAKEM